MWDDVTSNASTKHPKIVVYSIKDKVGGSRQHKSRVTQKSRPCTLILATLVGLGLELLVVREALGGSTRLDRVKGLNSLGG